MLRRVFLGLFLIFGLAQAALAEKRVALVLGVEDYKHLRPLDNPVSDARALEALLEGLGFEVTLETDRDLKRMRRALEDFREDGAGADVALFFFAGHGVAVEGVNYLLPVDAQVNSSQALTASSLPLSEVHEVLNAVAPVSIMLLDACRDDPFAGGGASADDRSAKPLADNPPEAPKPVPGLGRIGRADGVLFAFAAAPGETASDGKDGNSPFTSALLRHFGTRGVELKSALTLVQQDVYDRSRGKQLPYLESGLPSLVFISGEGDLPERDQLLIAMAGLTPDLRVEVESVAAANDMPLAPLYAALISGDLGSVTPEERRQKLEEAARSYAAFQSELVKYSSDDPKVDELRIKAEEQLSLGSFEAARALLTEAAKIDSTARKAIRNNYLSRTLSEASTHVLNANAARTDLRYDLAINDLNLATELYAEVEADLPDRETKVAFLMALQDLGDLYRVAGNTFGALGAHTTRAEFAENQARIDPSDIGWTSELVWALKDQGTVLMEQGYLPEAAAAFQHAFEFSQWATDQLPDDPDLMRNREVIQNMIGQIAYAQADYRGALDAHLAALEIAQKLLDLDPTLVMYLKDMSYTQERIGDVWLALGDTVQARDSFDISLKISQDLSNEFPLDQTLRGNVAVGFERLAAMMAAEGDNDSALAIYLEALKIRDELLAREPNNTMHQRSSSVTIERIGDVYEAMGDVGSALMSHQQVMQIREALVALDPANITWARDLSVTYERIGTLHFNEGDHAGAQDYYDRSRVLREGIVALDGSQTEAQRDLGLAYERLSMAWNGLGDADTALEFARKALEVRRGMVAANPAIALYRQDMGFSLTGLADMLARAGDAEGAQAAWQEAVEVRSALAADYPDAANYLSEAVIARYLLADLLNGRGDYAAAVPLTDAGLAESERLLALSGASGAVIDRLNIAFRAGEARRGAGDLQAALAAYRIMAEMATRLVTEAPGDLFSAADYALAHERIGDVLNGLKDHAGARAALETALQFRQWLVGQQPGALQPQRDLSYCLQKLADALYLGGTPDQARPLDDQALGIARWVLGQEPDNVWNVIDLVNALDRMTGYAGDPAPFAREALALLEGLQAAGTLPDDRYLDWMANYRKALGIQ